MPSATARAPVRGSASGCRACRFRDFGAEAACLSQSEARTAVSSGEARPLGSIAGAVSGEIVRADLCREGGRLVYVLSVLTGGRVANMVVDARSGRLLR